MARAPKDRPISPSDALQQHRIPRGHAAPEGQDPPTIPPASRGQLQTPGQIADAETSRRDPRTHG
jgi:hypothetical protein